MPETCYGKTWGQAGKETLSECECGVCNCEVALVPPQCDCQSGSCLVTHRTSLTLQPQSSALPQAQQDRAQQSVKSLRTARRLQLNPRGLGSSHSPQLSRAHLAHAPHDAELLGVDEALQHHPDGHVDIILHHVVAQVHAGVRLGHADHGLDVPHRDGDAARRLREEAARYSRTQHRCLPAQDPAPVTPHRALCTSEDDQDKKALPPAGTATQPGTASLFI